MPESTDVRELRVRVGKEVLRELRILAAEEDTSLANLTRVLLAGGLALVKAGRAGTPETAGRLPEWGIPLEGAQAFTAALLRSVHAVDEAETAYGAPMPDVGTPPDLQEKLDAYRRGGGVRVTDASET